VENHTGSISILAALTSFGPPKYIMSEKVKKIIRVGNRVIIRVDCKSGGTLLTRLVKLKPDSQHVNKEIVYSIPCRCGKEYISETERPLITRVKENQTALKKGDTVTSKLVEYAWNLDHNFEFDRAKSIGREKGWKARKCHEAIEIYLGGPNVVNAASMDIDPVWFSTLDELTEKMEKKMNTAPPDLRR
jgi:hypothetical protein